MDTPTGVETVNGSLSCSVTKSKFVATYRVIKDKLAPGFIKE